MKGLFVEGMFCGTDQKEFKNPEDGRVKLTYYVLLSSGTDFYKLSCDKDYTDHFMLGDVVKFKVRPRVYNNSIYFYGEHVEE